MSPLPASLGRTPLPAPKRRAAKARQHGARIDFEIEHQAQPQWCWAAVATSLGLYYKTGRWTQCELATEVLRAAGILGQDQQAGCGRDCCGDAPADVCNQPWRLSEALGAIRCDVRVAAGGPKLRRLRKAFSVGRPVSVEIVWTGGGCHFVVLDGISFGGRWLGVSDPMTGRAVVARDSFPAHYHSGGALACTLFARPKATR